MADHTKFWPTPLFRAHSRQGVAMGTAFIAAHTEAWSRDVEWLSITVGNRLELRAFLLIHLEIETIPSICARHSSSKGEVFPRIVASIAASLRSVRVIALRWSGFSVSLKIWM